jgi:hypothetical protein
LAANQLGVSGYSKRNSCLMVLLKSTRLDLLQKGIHKSKERTSSILTHLLLE